MAQGPKRVQGVKAKGLAYERKVHKELVRLLGSGYLRGELLAGPWIEFVDDNGPGLAQPDFILFGPIRMYLFEAKLSQTDLAWAQLELLYRPLVEFIYSRPATCVQVCKNLREDVPGIVHDPRLLAHGATWHWA